MQRVIAHIVSGLLHPLIMPSLGVLFIFFTSSHIILLPYEAQRIILIIVAINTLVLPMLMIPLFYRFGIIKSIQMKNHRERIIPLAFTLIPYIFSYYFLNRLPIVSEISLFMLGAALTVFFTLIISIWWKISVHMVGVGGLFGLLYALTFLFQANNIWVILVVIAATGIVAWARLTLNAHKPSQVYAGFILGAVVVSAMVVLV
ncbi:MAG: hypothetical protein PHD06_01760 [Bacteroidales bacterium]|nr:hypothetical protein [Bacteroidales bacterium]MDD4383885.1 hypothetical protein [Bacteroidales bacterium]MDY0198369.1 hypothetical protein [Tenuifilaceae bacterium]